VLATGAKPILPEIPGVDQPHVVQAWDVLAGKAGVGRSVVVVGGNAVGLETAMYLARIGSLTPEVLHFLVANRAESMETLMELLNRGSKEVTVVEMIKKAGKDIGFTTRWTIMAELRRLGATIMTGTRAVRITAEGLEIDREDGPGILAADSIVMAAGSRAENSLAKDLEGVAPEFYMVGDATEPRKAMEAIREGFETGLRI